MFIVQLKCVIMHTRNDVAQKDAIGITYCSAENVLPVL